MLVICLLSGGASALLVATVAGITLHDKQVATSLLLQAGASIGELNAVRKHLSAVKGGRLAGAAQPAQVLTLVISDVIGDRLDVIASGPTTADSSTFADAWAVITKYHLREKVPLRVMACLKRGMAGEEAETAKGELSNVHNVIVAGNKLALAAAQEQAQLLGYACSLLSTKIQGEAREVAHFLAQAARATLAEMHAGERRCLLSGGETTVTVKGAGKGGRNQELALAFALEVEEMPGVTLLSAGTDGTDGPTDAAGAIVNGDTATQARELGLVPEQFLSNNDSCTFFQKLDAGLDLHSHLITGPTGTNVMDVQILLLQK
jgi:glycerate-2-kinase